MQIKRFEARNMTEALRVIKKEFGPDAVILSAKNLTRQAADGEKPKAYVEVLAAIDETDVKATQSVATRVPPPRTQPQAAAAKVISAYIGDEADDDTPPVPKKSLFGSLQAGIQVFSRFKIGRKTEASGSKEPSSAAEVVDAFRRKLVSHGVEERWALELEDILRRSIKGGMHWGTEACNDKLLQVLKDVGLSCRPLAEETQKRRAYALVGSSGCGKTTTAVRLATLYHHVIGERLVLVSLDTKRVGASATLQAYARILGVPFEMAVDGKDLLQVIESVESETIVLIDTPPLVPADPQQTRELQQTFTYAGIDRLALVLPMGMKNEDMKEMVKHCQPLPVKRLIFTKLDETRYYGGMLNVMLASKLPLSFLTSGRDILDGLKVAELKAVLHLLLDIEEEHDTDTPPTMGVLDQEIDRLMAVSKGRTYYVADQKEDVYHRPACKCVQGVSIENRIVFNSAAEAEMKHYSPCLLCCTDPSFQQAAAHVGKQRIPARLMRSR